MRLLECSDGKLKLTKDLLHDVPRYAILSHTWGLDTEEVTFRDLVDGTGEDKIGYEKIRFCAEQAKRDGLQHFWVDTCCIDKSNNNELSTAINSMFRWYQNAARCYVYLSDISATGCENSQQSGLTWESAFRAHRWFTRGWTLQELLAPASVEFFGQTSQRFGDKRSLEQQIHEITGIAVLALRGSDLSQFDVEERFKWARTRQTTREEDWAYCLLGIFGIFMPLIYGEGKTHAVYRLKKEIADAMSRDAVPKRPGDKATGYEVGSQKVQDIRVYLDSVSKALEERQKDLDVTQDAAAPKTTVEVDMDKPMTAWPTYEAWMDSFTPSQQDIQHDEEASVEKENRGKGKQPEAVLASSGPKGKSKSVPDTVRIFITGLSEQLTSDTGKMMTMSPHAEVADILETLHKEGLNWPTGFAVGEGDETPLIGPIINQSAKCMLSTTSSASSYDITTGYAINMDETLVSFFNRTLMARRPERNEISISHSFDDIQVNDNYRNNPKLTVKLMRTVRVPDDSKTYNLPQDFGPFPILDTKDFAETLPPGMKEQGGIFISMLLREALFLSIVSPESYGGMRWSQKDPGEDPEDEIFAVRVLAGRANVISGSDPLSEAKLPSQDYIIVPKQRRLDGFLAQGKRGTIRQFNAASLRSGYSVEAQVSGTEVGGIQVQFAPRYKRNVAFYAQGTDGDFSTLLDLTATPRELELKPGVLLVMATLHDPNFYPPCWTWEHKRPHAFDGWGFRLGEWSANKSQHEFLKMADASTGVSGGTFPSDAQGVSYKEQRPQTQQPRPEKLNVGHVEFARPSRISDLFAAAGVSYQTPLFIRVVRPVNIRFEVIVTQALREKNPCLPAQYVLEITASIFEDAASFRQRAKAAVLVRTNEMIESSRRMAFSVRTNKMIERPRRMAFSSRGLKARCDGPPKWQMQDNFGNVSPCYMPLHDLEISRTLKGKLYISVWRRKNLGPKMRVSLGGGGIVSQDIHKDKTPRLWNWDAAKVINIQVLNAVAFKSVTGIIPPIPAISFEEYTRTGLPLLSFQGPNEGRVSKLVAAPGAWVKSFGQIDQEHGLAIGIRVRKDNGPVICSWCEHRLCDSILLPCRHIFCTWCVRVHMTRRKAVTCRFCNTPVPNVKIYAAATAVDGFVPKQQKDEAASPTKQPVQKLEELCENRVRWGGKLDSPDYKPVHARVLDGGTWGRKVGDSDWNLMIAQVLREWEIGLRTEEEVRDLVSYVLTSEKVAAEGTPEALEILLSLGAKPRNAEERERVLQALKERRDLRGLHERFLAEWE